MGSLRNFYESLLNELRGSSHGIRVDLDVGQQVGVAPVVSFGGRAAQFDAHSPLYQVRHEVLVGIAGGNVSIGIVGGIMQRHMAGIGMKDSDDLRLGVGVGDIIGDELKVENRGRQSPSNASALMLYTVFTSLSFTGISMWSGFSETDMSRLLLSKRVVVVGL